MIDVKHSKLAREVKLVNIIKIFQMAQKSMKYTSSGSGEMKGMACLLKGKQWSYEGGVYITYYAMRIICDFVNYFIVAVFYMLTKSCPGDISFIQFVTSIYFVNRL